MLRGVIFDLDGVVIDSHPIHRRAWRRFLESLNVPVTDEQLEFVTQGGKREDILRYFLGPLSDEQVQKYGVRKEALFREEAFEIQPVKGLAELLTELEATGVCVGLASCGSRARVRYVLERLGWITRFVAIVTGDDVLHGKPDPTIFWKAAAQMQVSAEHSVVIEDAVPGIRAARAAGMRAVGIATNGGTQALLAAGASRVVHDFYSLRVPDLQGLFE